jgi:hypothetical protein
MSHKLSPLARKLIAYGVALLVGGGVALIYFGVNGLFTSTLPSTDVPKLLSNGFFFGGAILAGVGALVFVSNEGAFNFLNYAAQKLLSRFFHSMKAATESYTDFTLDHDSKKAPFGFLLWPGLLYVLIGGIFAIIYMQNPTQVIALL